MIGQEYQHVNLLVYIIVAWPVFFFLPVSIDPTEIVSANIERVIERGESLEAVLSHRTRIAAGMIW